MGNIRVSFTREGAQAAIVEKNDYYAFGLKHGTTSDTSGVNYNYEYNGKEFQQEIGMNDYGARFYMPDIGRWGVVDPLAEVYRRHSPYNYAVNNPMRFIDPDGMAARGTFDAGVEYTGQDAIDLFNAIKNLYGYNDNSNGDIPAPKVNSIDQSEAGTAGGGSSPTFQFPKGQEAYYQKNYPAFYDLVKYILPKMVQDKNFMNALSSVSGFSLEDLIEIFQYGKGGILSAEDIWPEAEYPYAHSQDKRLINSIIVDTDVLNWFEGANRNSKSFEGVVNIFYMVMVIGHETSHWGNWTKRTIRFENSGAPELFGSTEIGYFFEYSTLKSVYPNYPVRSGLNIGNFGNNISEQLKGFVKKNFSTLSNIFSN